MTCSHGKSERQGRPACSRHGRNSIECGRGTVATVQVRPAILISLLEDGETRRAGTAPGIRKEPCNKTRPRTPCSRRKPRPCRSRQLEQIVTVGQPSETQSTTNQGVVGSIPAGRAKNQGLRISKPGPRRACATLAGLFIHSLSHSPRAESCAYQRGLALDSPA